MTARTMTAIQAMVISMSCPYPVRGLYGLLVPAGALVLTGFEDDPEKRADRKSSGQDAQNEQRGDHLFSSLLRYQMALDRSCVRSSFLPARRMYLTALPRWKPRSKASMTSMDSRPVLLW